MKKPVYLDYNATTPLEPEVLEAMLPYFKEGFGNPANCTHSYGWEAKDAVEKARKQVADTLGANKDEIIFTSGATESNNIAILGLIKNFLKNKPHIITSQVEHKAVCTVCQLADEWGAEVTRLPVDEYGRVSVAQLEDSIRPNTKLITVMMANNEIGTINPIKEIGAIAKAKGIFFHTDAAQAVGKVPIDVNDLGVDMLSLSGHKIYGPKGIGALYVRSDRPKVMLSAIAGGGMQEHGLRPGTHNVPAIVGLGVACELADKKLRSECERLSQLRDNLISRVLEAAPEAILNGHPIQRLCNNVSFSFKGLCPEDLSLGLNGLAISTGSACCTESEAPSHVISALGRDDTLARATLRLSIGLYTSQEDIDFAVEKILSMLERKRKKAQ